MKTKNVGMAIAKARLFNAKIQIFSIKIHVVKVDLAMNKGFIKIVPYLLSLTNSPE
ncbi:hypothetical protein NBT05_08100 [Aquimarina sp. ERC-38]|uniref:hypothetical protein n=1 Tax=Aquimarina sp. ERC-38 TaxID=2949996 RepID=UPI0022462713|nr:hypothetical protein [Aquimarina sp. ERC-38]UZO82424.1 hypothetical protein NBT05_08100 [Aquimarina sp. ERC-38]